MDTMIFLSVMATWNVIILALFGIDKLRAAKNNWRISETTLIISAFLLGGIGAICGMVVFHHKVSKVKFRLLIPLALLTTVIVLCSGFYFKLLR